MVPNKKSYAVIFEIFACGQSRPAAQMARKITDHFMPVNHLTLSESDETPAVMRHARTKGIRLSRWPVHDAAGVRVADGVNGAQLSTDEQYVTVGWSSCRKKEASTAYWPAHDAAGVTLAEAVELTAAFNKHGSLIARPVVFGRPGTTGWFFMFANCGVFPMGKGGGNNASKVVLGAEAVALDVAEAIGQGINAYVFDFAHG